MSRLYLSPPDLRTPERERLLAAFDSGWVAPVGPELEAFEEEIAARCGRAHGVALSSGTAALHLAVLGLGVGEGDEIVVPTFTFAATVNALAYVGARPVFVDSSPTSWNLDPDLLDEELASGRPAGVITVDLYGRCADYDRIGPACAALDVALVEDAAEALGSTHLGEPAGSFGAAGTVSFNGNKVMTTGGGGMLVCDDAQLATRARYLATQARQPSVHYEHTEVGYNYRLSNLLAAVGRGQLVTLDERIARRRGLRRRYRKVLAGWPGLSFGPGSDEDNAWLTCVLIDPEVAGVDREAVRLHLESVDIESRPLWKPMHRQAAFAGCRARITGVADDAFAQGLCLPSGSGMSDADQDRVLEALDEVLAER